MATRRERTRASGGLSGVSTTEPTTELRCEKHNTPTQLTCAQCGKPSCTKCLVWTEVGQKCRTCVPGKGGSDRSSSLVPILVVGALLIALVVSLRVFTSDSGSSEVPERGNRGSTQPGIGQPARDGGLTFVVTRFECGADEVGQGARTKIALGRFCLLEFKATNSGNDPTAFAAPLQRLLDGQRRRFVFDPVATDLYRQTTSPGGSSSAVQQMNPGSEVETSLVYDIPDDVVPELAELHGSTNTLGVTVRLTEAAGLGG